MLAQEGPAQLKDSSSDVDVDGMAGAPQHLDGLIRQSIDPLQVMQRVSDQIVAMVDKADGALVGLRIDDDYLRFVSASGHLAPQVGDPMPMQGSLCGESIRSGSIILSEDTEADPRVLKERTRAYDIGSGVLVPLGGADHKFGVLAVCSRRSGAFGPMDLELFSGLADFISTAVRAATEMMEITARLCDRKARGLASGEDAERTNKFVASVLDPQGVELLDATERVERVLAERGYEIVFQPIYDLQSGGIFALEALARFEEQPYRSPDVWLAEAHHVGLGVELEHALLTAALECLDQLPDGTVMTVNAGPEALAAPGAAELLQRLDPSRVVVELTEHAAVEDYPALADALAGLRAAGVRLAIDDAGAGFASLMHILRLAPDFIKLDRQLICGLDVDPVRRSLAASLMRFAEESGATIVAEGVETGSELEALSALGLRHAQGFYLARPAPITDLERMGRSGAARVRRGTRPATRAVARTKRAASTRA
jgi:EAL domain-containing protein (putative c-di-GMP-specific phosphodiesterase class I)/putative methionine-R-sulfoxide reductase with GAF domain